MGKNRVLIVGSIKDPHVDEIAKRLRALGGHCDVLDFAELGNGAVESVQLNPPRYLFSSAGQTINAEDFDGVWFRRLGAPATPLKLAPSSESVWKTETNIAIKASVRVLQHLIGTWYNDFDGVFRAQNKSLQLLMAQQAGLATPTTLLSNDPKAILEFARAHPGGVVHKMHHQALFDGQQKPVTTSALSIEMIELNWDALTLCSGIFQEQRRFDQELRLFVMNEIIISRP